MEFIDIIQFVLHNLPDAASGSGPGGIVPPVAGGAASGLSTIIGNIISEGLKQAVHNKVQENQQQQGQKAVEDRESGLFGK